MATFTYTIGSAADFNAALQRADVGGADAGAGNTYNFNLTGGFTLDRQLFAINLQGGTAGGSVANINGGGATINGGNTYNGLFVYGGNVNVNDLTIANAVAQGGAGGGQRGGGGAGLGGGLFVAGTNNTNGSGATLATGGNVTLTNVNFTGNAARGGAGGGSPNSGTYGGGGGLGGSGGSSNTGNGGGGIGIGASGGANGTNGANGIVLGAASGGGGSGGGTGGANGGGGGTTTTSGGGGGVGGAAAPNTTTGGAGGFGGGGGNDSVGNSVGGAGGFGGGGGGGVNSGGGGAGGFGGGGGGGGATNTSTGGAGGFGGGSGRGAGGGAGGGLGAGADVFVEQGGQLTIAGTTNLTAGTVTGGTGTSGNAGAALGSGIFIQGNQTVTITPGAGNTTTVSGVIADQTGSQGQLTATQGTGTGAGNLVIGAGTTSLTAANTYTGGTTLNAGSNLSLSAPTSAGTGAIAFAGTAANPGQLTLQAGAQTIGGTFGNRLDNFTGTNSLDLRGFTYNGTAAYTATNNQITITGGTGGTQTQTFRLQNGATSYIASSDGAGGTLVRQVAPTPTNPPAAAPCYVTGTRIRVLRELTILDVPVEHLRVGDLALTAGGKPRPIRWIGTRAYPGLSAPKHDRPVRIRAGALGEGMPARDLLVSPDHCLWLDGLLVAAGHLSNGTSIVRGEAVRDLTYWHVELDSHDLLLAENTPAESFLAAPGVRAGFDGVEADEAPFAPVAYALRAERYTPETDALRERLILRAGLSVEPMRYGAVRAWLDVCDGARVAGWARDDAHPDAPVCLDILVDGTVVAMALTQDHRADLAAAGMGDGRHGFDITLDEPLMRGVAHTVEVRRSADGLRVGAMAVDEAGAWTALLAA